jgi:hypothetical protein
MTRHQSNFLPVAGSALPLTQRVALEFKVRRQRFLLAIVIALALPADEAWARAAAAVI